MNYVKKRKRQRMIQSRIDYNSVLTSRSFAPVCQHYREEIINANAQARSSMK